ncbi:MAG: amidohydrolase family protein, partial [Actinomycetota bacterium]|nr:amidohydrolase family protein [Actinomycetota bacterium]
MTSYRCDFAWLGTSSEVERDVLIDVDGDRITRVTAATADPRAADEATLLHGLTIPGMANCHSHAFHRAIRGRTQRGAGSFWTWREAMYEVAAILDPDTYRDLATATYAEMALSGVTAVGEFHYLHHQRDGTPYTDGNAMGAALVDAAREAGLRITLLDACYLHGGIGVGPDATQRQ